MGSRSLAGVQQETEGEGVAGGCKAEVRGDKNGMTVGIKELRIYGDG